MDNATLQPLTANTAAADAPPPGFAARLMALPMSRKLLLGGGLLALVAVLAAAVMMNTKADYKVLFANLSDKDGGAIVAQLTQMNVPYKYSEGGQAMDHQESYLKVIFGFMGITDITIVRAEGVALGADIKAAAVQAAKAQVEQLEAVAA